MLVEKTVAEFLDDVASNSAAPGGGSVAALAGALGAGLTAMVCRLTIGKKRYADVQSEMEGVLARVEALRTELTTLVEKDTEAFHAVMKAFSLPKETEEQREIRHAAVQEATKAAAVVPLAVMELCERTLPLTQTVATKGNVNSLSDAGVAASMLYAACVGAALNVRINLGTIQDDTFVHDTKVRAEHLLASVAQRHAEIQSHIASSL
jgi:formiminotetrahydrofolate cyclodeaminase